MKTSMRIPVPGTYNFRDVGGLPARDGRPCATACCTGPTGCTASARRAGPSCASSASASSSTCATRTSRGIMPDDLDGLDVEVLQLPVFEGSGASQGARGISLDALYERIVTQHSAVVVSALREIASAGDRAVVVHCTAGKDRTGVVVALALMRGRRRPRGGRRRLRTHRGQPRRRVARADDRDDRRVRGARHARPAHCSWAGARARRSRACSTRSSVPTGRLATYLLEAGLTIGELADLERLLIDAD